MLKILNSLAVHLAAMANPWRGMSNTALISNCIEPVVRFCTHGLLLAYQLLYWYSHPVERKISGVLFIFAEKC